MGLAVVIKGAGFGEGLFPGFAGDEEAAATVETYLRCDTGSPEEGRALEAMQTAGVEIAPHVGSDGERKSLLDGQLRGLTPQARAEGFGR